MSTLTIHPANFGSAFSRATLVLEGVVLDLLCAGWEDDSRQLAERMAGSLRRAAHETHWWTQESTLRAIESLLGLSSTEFLPIREAAAPKLLELLTLLKKSPASRSA